MRRVDHLEQMIPYMFAHGCARAWLTLLFADPAVAPLSPFDPHVPFDYSFALAGIGIALAARRVAPLQGEAVRAHLVHSRLGLHARRIALA